MRFLFGFVVVLVSFSCMIYELALAQTSSVLLGNALLNYSVTICIYLAALGAGSLLFSRFELEKAGPLLLNAELALTYLGPLAPILALGADFLLRQPFPAGSQAYVIGLQVVMYGLVAVVGLLSGFELPILISLGDRFRMGSGAVLGLDYAGTLIGIALFPTIGLGKISLFGAAASAGIGSWLGAVLTLQALPRAQRRRSHYILLVPSLLMILLLLWKHNSVREFMSHAVYLGEGL